MMMLLRPSPAVVILCHALAAESLEVLMWLEACGRTRARHKVVHLVRRLIHSDFSLNVLAENVAPWEELPPVHVLDHRCILRVHSVVRLRLPAPAKRPCGRRWCNCNARQRQLPMPETDLSSSLARHSRCCSRGGNPGLPRNFCVP